MKRFITTILLLLPLLTKASGEKKWGLTYAERQRIWWETIQARNRADVEATEALGQIRGKAIMRQIAAWGEESDRRVARYISDLQLAHRISSSVYDSVIAEGIKYDWPRH